MTSKNFSRNGKQLVVELDSNQTDGTTLVTVYRVIEATEKEETTIEQTKVVQVEDVRSKRDEAGNIVMKEVDGRQEPETEKFLTEKLETEVVPMVREVVVTKNKKLDSFIQYGKRITPLMWTDIINCFVDSSKEVQSFINS